MFLFEAGELYRCTEDEAQKEFGNISGMTESPEEDDEGMAEFHILNMWEEAKRNSLWVYLKGIITTESGFRGFICYSS